MAFFSRTFSELTSDCISDLSSYTNFTRLSAGAKARALLESVNRRLEEAYNTFDLNLARAFLSSAPGQYLDLFGELFGIEREKAQAASTSEEAQVQKFYVETGTFGNINNGNSILVPAGTLVGTASGGTGTVFKLRSGLLLSSSDSEAYAAIEASNTGTDSNKS